MSDEVALLRRLSGELDGLSKGTSARLASLANALEHPDTATGWSGIDPLRAIDVQAVGDVVRTRPERDPILARVEQIRNMLTLLPILFTWLALYFAGGAYRDAVESDASLAQVPFLLLWEQGFNGYGKGALGALSFLTLSNVALFDVGVITVVVLMTGYIHHHTNVKQTQLAIRATDLEEALRQALWLASMQLAERVSAQVQQDQFRAVTEQLLDELKAERQRQGELADARTRELEGLSAFSRDFRSGVRDLAHTADVLRANQLVLVELGGAVYDKLSTTAQQTMDNAHALTQLKDKMVREEEAATTRSTALLETITALRESSLRGLETALAGVASTIAIIEGRQPKLELLLVDLNKQVAQTGELVLGALADERVISAVSSVHGELRDLATLERTQSAHLVDVQRGQQELALLVTGAGQSVQDMLAKLTVLIGRIEKDDFGPLAEALQLSIRTVVDQLSITGNALDDLQRVISALGEIQGSALGTDREPVYNWRLYGPAGNRPRPLAK